MSATTEQQLNALVDRAEALSLRYSGDPEQLREPFALLLNDIAAVLTALTAEAREAATPLEGTLREGQQALRGAGYEELRLALARLAWDLHRVQEQWPVRVTLADDQLRRFVADVVGGEAARALTGTLAGRELRLLAQMVNQLRFWLRPEGVVMFLTRERPDGTAPVLDRLADPAQERNLLADAASGREMICT